MEGIKQKLNKGETVIGTFLSLGNPITTEMIAQAGFDWVVIDLEHGLGDEQAALHQVLSLKNTATTAIVRVESHQKQRIHRVLDFGAGGIMCPRVDNASDAALAIKAMHYPPQGIRGVAKMIPVAGYGMYFDQYLQSTTTDLLGIIQVETSESLNHLDAIAAVNGVDVLFIGPSDLSMSLGIFGQTNHPLFLETIDAIVSAAKKAGKHTGILIADPAETAKYQNLGIHCIACGTEAGFLMKGASATVKNMRAAIGKA